MFYLCEGGERENGKEERRMREGKGEGAGYRI